MAVSNNHAGTPVFVGRAQTCTAEGLPRPGKGWRAAVLSRLPTTNAAHANTHNIAVLRHVRPEPDARGIPHKS